MCTYLPLFLRVFSLNTEFKLAFFSIFWLYSFTALLLPSFCWDVSNYYFCYSAIPLFLLLPFKKMFFSSQQFYLKFLGVAFFWWLLHIFSSFWIFVLMNSIDYKMFRSYLFKYCTCSFSLLFLWYWNPKLDLFKICLLLFPPFIFFFVPQYYILDIFFWSLLRITN